MENSNEVYTFGLWTVKPGKEAEFIAAWESFARWTSEHQPGMAGEALLLQDLDQPKRLVSIGGWTDRQRVEAWRQLPEFRAFFAKAKELCEEMQPHSLKPVVRIAQAGTGTQRDGDQEFQEFQEHVAKDVEGCANCP